MGNTRGMSKHPIFVALGLCAAVTVVALAIPANSDASGAYPVRLCSPETFRADGTGGTFGTGNSDVGILKTYATYQGNISYGPAGNWNAWHPVMQCAAMNTNNPGQHTYGMRLFTNRDAGWHRDQGGGLEIVPPAGMTIAQVSFKARALLPPSWGHQGGLGGGGTKMLWEFVGAPNSAGTSGGGVPAHEAFGSYGSAGAVQAVSAYRIGQVCEPSGTATICFGPNESLLIQDLIVTLMDRIKPNVRILDSPAALGNWVSGEQRIGYLVHDGESGIRETEVFLDGKLIDSKTYSCHTVSGFNAGDVSVPMAARMKPCSNQLEGGAVILDTKEFGDGEHQLKVCARDFASATTYWSQDPPSCTDTTIRIDNTAPTAPEAMEAVPTRVPRAVEPNDIGWNDPGKGDPGAPVRAAVYEITDQNGQTVVEPRVVTVNGPASVPANSAQARNVEAVPTLSTPTGAGNYTVRVRLIDAVGHVSGVSTVPLRYSCQDSGGAPLPETNVGLGLVREGYHQTTATAKLALPQGGKAALLGQVRGPGGMPFDGARTCVNAKPVTDPQLALMTSIQTDRQGQYRTDLRPGPSRNLVAVVRQGHRESWSGEALTRVRVKPKLRVKRKRIRAGQVLQLTGKIPGPRAGRVTVVLQAKVGKGWQAFRYYRTRANGKYRLRYRPRAGHLTRPTKFVVRAVVPLQSGYPYQEGSSSRRTIVIRPRP